MGCINYGITLDLDMARGENVRDQFWISESHEISVLAREGIRQSIECLTICNTITIGLVNSVSAFSNIKNFKIQIWTENLFSFS